MGGAQAPAGFDEPRRLSYAALVKEALVLVMLVLLIAPALVGIARVRRLLRRPPGEE